MERALVTGVSRRAGIGAAIARRLAADGWDVVSAGWREYDDRMPWGRDDGPEIVEADLADPDAPADLVGRAGTVTAGSQRPTTAPGSCPGCCRTRAAG